MCKLVSILVGARSLEDMVYGSGRGLYKKVARRKSATSKVASPIFSTRSAFRTSAVVQIVDGYKLKCAVRHPA
jgi:hypothetical protein